MVRYEHLPIYEAALDLAVHFGRGSAIDEIERFVIP